MRTSVAQRRKNSFTRTLTSVIRTVLLMCIPTTFLIMGVVILFSDYFTIKVINVDVNDALDAQEIKKVLYDQLDTSRLSFIRQKNIFFFNSEEAFTSLTSRFHFDTLVIMKDYPSTLHVTGKGGRYRLLWYYDGIFFFVDERGVITGPADRSVIDGLSPDIIQRVASDRVRNEHMIQNIPENTTLEIPPLIIGKGGQAQGSKDGDIVISAKDVIPLIAVRSQLQHYGMDMAFIEYTRGDQTIIIHMKDGWDLSIMLDDMIERQIHQVAVVLNEHIRNDRSRLRKIDARFDNRFFYTLNE